LSSVLDAASEEKKRIGREERDRERRKEEGEERGKDGEETMEEEEEGKRNRGRANMESGLNFSSIARPVKMKV